MTAVLESIFSDLVVGSPSVAYVGSANGDDGAFYDRMASMLKQSHKCRVLHAVTATKNADFDRALEVMRSADAVFVSGGDVEAGMEVLESGGVMGAFREFYEGGKLLFGVSAGSIMLAREWVRWTNPDDDSSAELFPCLGVAPVLCDTHGEGDDWEELKAAVRLKSCGSLGYGITSGSCLKVTPEGTLSSLGGPISVFKRATSSVTRLPDLVP